jgi:hypothetical protein
MTSFRGQACLAKITSPRGQLVAVACHPTKKSLRVASYRKMKKTKFVFIIGNFNSKNFLKISTPVS